MINKPTIGAALAIGAAVMANLLGGTNVAQAQMPLPFYTVPTPTAHAPGNLFRHSAMYPPAIPVQATLPTFYAPQVPVVPMANGPVPTMSAYYVPTIPTTQMFCAPVIRYGVLRRQNAVVLPSAVIHPVYWYH